MKELTPKQIVRELNKYIIGQSKAKKAVAIAMRNRWRRQQVSGYMRDEIMPNNIIMIGSTGVGKTEISRRLAALTSAPFVKVEASKFTEVGYVGRDVESMIRDLMDTSYNMVQREKEEEVIELAERLANERIGTVSCALELSKSLNRKISVCDPYAGVGPSVIPLANLNQAVSQIYASDLNPHAAELLGLNLPNQWTGCRDARQLSKELAECCDLLLVNLPHDSISHLPDLLDLLRKGHEVVIRGWAILALDSINQAETEIRKILSQCEILSLALETNRSYSPTDAYVCIEAHIIR